MSNEEIKLTQQQEQEIALKNSTVTIVVNVLLSIAKLIVGILGKSAAMVADAVHSFSDVFSTVIVIMGVRKSAEKGKSDNGGIVAGIVLSSIVAVVGICLGWFAVKDISSGFTGWISVPAKFTAIAAAVSIVVKELMFWYTRAAAVKIESEALLADAWHHRSDAFSSVASLIGIIMALKGYNIMDSVAGLMICLFILKAAFDMFMEALDKIYNKPLGEQTLEVLKKLVMKDERIIRVERLDSCVSGMNCTIEIDVVADGNMSLFEANDISKDIHERIENIFPQIDKCMVKVLPESIADEG
ncbi:MAG: cation transporter [Ruminococcus sp.]|nr:cation transporter [Ruminococcus sp.]